MDGFGYNVSYIEYDVWSLPHFMRQRTHTYIRFDCDCGCRRSLRIHCVR